MGNFITIARNNTRGGLRGPSGGAPLKFQAREAPKGALEHSPIGFSAKKCAVTAGKGIALALLQVSHHDIGES